MRAREWGAGQVGTEQLHLSFVLVFDDPDEARAEHGVGSFDHLDAQGVVAGEGVLDFQHEGAGGFGLLRGEAAEEDVVVAGHGGVVEEGCVVRGAAVFFDEAMRFGGCVGGALEEGWGLVG